MILVGHEHLVEDMKQSILNKIPVYFLKKKKKKKKKRITFNNHKLLSFCCDLLIIG
jgi:hypothetical protein